MIVFLDGQYLSMEEASLSPDNRGFVFGDGVYEVVRIYNGRFYEMKAHEKRLLESAAAIGISLEGFQGMEAIARTLVSKNIDPTTDGFVYYQITRGTAPRKHYFPDPPVAPSHYAFVRELPVPDHPTRPGASAIALPDRRWLDCHIKSIALLGSVLAAQKASEQGAQEAILHRDGTVTEGSHTNVFAVVDGVLRTHPADHFILNGISRRVVLKLAATLGIPFEERAVCLEELAGASEIFITGTTVEIHPVTRLDGNEVGNGKTGPIAAALLKAFDPAVDLLD